MDKATLEKELEALGLYLKDKRVIFNTGEIIIECDPEGVNYDLLTKLSVLVGTTNISLGNDIRNGGYCETCSYEYGIMVITCKL